MHDYIVKLIRFIVSIANIKADEIYVLREGSRYLPRDAQRVRGEK